MIWQKFPLQPPPYGHWRRHMAIVPKGFLLYHVLKLLSEKPLSGSEIMDEIERRTSRHWRPSPGSVYPLLAWLQDNNYIKPILTEEAGVKRYMLTEKGKSFLEEQHKIRIHLAIKRGMLPLLLAFPRLSAPEEKVEAFRGALETLFKNIFSLGAALEKKFSEQTLDEMLKILNEAAQKLEDLEKKAI